MAEAVRLSVDRESETHAGTEIQRFGSFACRQLLQLVTRQLHANTTKSGFTAALSRVRGTGPGVSLSLLIRAIRVAYPRRLVFPFENSHFVGGAVLQLSEILDEDRDDAFLLLRFRPGAVDLPMHAHLHSCRCIIAIGGRGYFHITTQGIGNFDGSAIRTYAVRQRDVLTFKRGTIHTFSTTTKHLDLLSYHQPYIPLDAPDQYTLPAHICCPGIEAPASDAKITCDPAWSLLQ